MDSIKSGKVTQDEAMLEVDRIQGTAEVLGEDYSFCRLARKAGFEVWCDPLFDVHHYGEYPFGRNDWWFRHGKALAEKQKEAAAEV